MYFYSSSYLSIVKFFIFLPVFLLERKIIMLYFI